MQLSDQTANGDRSAERTRDFLEHTTGDYCSSEVRVNVTLAMLLCARSVVHTSSESGTANMLKTTPRDLFGFSALLRWYVAATRRDS